MKSPVVGAERCRYDAKLRVRFEKTLSFQAGPRFADLAGTAEPETERNSEFHCGRPTRLAAGTTDPFDHRIVDGENTSPREPRASLCDARQREAGFRRAGPRENDDLVHRERFRPR